MHVTGFKHFQKFKTLNHDCNDPILKNEKIMCLNNIKLRIEKEEVKIVKNCL